MSTIWGWFSKNWKSNVIATVAILYSATQFTAAVQAWENGQPANWRAGIVSLILAALGYVSKDASNHSTEAEVRQATIEKENK